MSRIELSTAMREAVATLLRDFATDAEIKLQVYPARPRSIHAPCAFIDTMRETVVYSGPTQRQRTPEIEVVVLHGLYDGLDAVTQRDRFVDGFIDWVTDRYHAAGANTLIAAVRFDDDPGFVPDWLPPDQQRVYFGTRITLEGYAA